MGLAKGMSLDKLFDIPEEDCHNEKNFMGPLITESRKVELIVKSIDCLGDEVQAEIDKVALKLGVKKSDLWISYDVDKKYGVTKVNIEAVDALTPVKYE